MKKLTEEQKVQAKIAQLKQERDKLKQSDTDYEKRVLKLKLIY